MVGLRFNSIGVSDGISNGTDGMAYSLQVRETSAHTHTHTHTHTTLHCTALHCTALHCTVLHSIKLSLNIPHRQR